MDLYELAALQASPKQQRPHLPQPEVPVLQKRKGYAVHLVVLESFERCERRACEVEDG